MPSKIVKWTAIAALVAGVFTRSAIGVAIILQLAVVVAAVIVLAQAVNLHRYAWVGSFLVIACLFNPVFPVPFSNIVFGAASASAALLFIGSLSALKTKPRLSITSITDMVPSSEAL